MGADDAAKQPPYFGDWELERDCPKTAMELWEGPRGLEEYAREMFPLEEHANGLTWMLDDEFGGGGPHDGAEPQGQTAILEEDPDEGEDEGEDEDEDEDEGLTMRGLPRDEEEWLA